MVRMQRLTAIVSTGLMVGALLACKKKPEAAPEASATPPAPVAPATTPATPTPAPTPEAATPPPAGTPKLGDVKRYGVEKESKLDEAGVRVALDEVKVFNEADTTTPEVATLPKGLLVFRLVKMDDFQLVEFPSGIGQFSKGWVESKGLTDKPEKVTRDAVLSEKKTATVKPADAGAPKPSPSGSAAPAPKPSASVAPPPKPSASVAPKPPAPPKPGTRKKPEDKEQK